MTTSLPRETPAQDRKRFVRVLLGLTLLAIFRMFYVSRIELAGDEAYYWLWSKHLDWSYYSKGPGIGWLIHAGTTLFGDTELGVRFPTIACTWAVGWIIWSLVRRLYDAATAEAAVWISLTFPIFTLGGVLMTIDPPSVTLWLAAVLMFTIAYKNNRLAAWMATGALVGIGMLFKLTNLAMLVSAGLFLWFNRKEDSARRGSGFFAMLLVALLCLAPVVIWNMKHEWITLQHLLTRGAVNKAFHPHWTAPLEFLGGQAGVLTPLYFMGVIWALVRRDWAASRPASFRLSACLVLPLPLFYTILSLNGEHEPNWTAPALASSLLLLVPAWRHFMAGSPRLWAWGRGAVVFAAAATVLLQVALVTPWIYGDHRFRRIGGGAELARQVAALQQTYRADFVIGESYQTASMIAFYSPDHPVTFIPWTGKMDNQYSFWPGYYDLHPAGSTALFVSRMDSVPEVLQKQFEHIRKMDDIQPAYHGRPLRKFFIYRCEHLRPLPLQAGSPAFPPARQN